MIEALFDPDNLLIETPFMRRIRQIGWKEGWAEGWAKGWAEVWGKDQIEGHRQGEAHLLKLLLRRRFGELPPWVKDRLQQACAVQLELWSLRVLDAHQLEQVFEE